MTTTSFSHNQSAFLLNDASKIAFTTASILILSCLAILLFTGSATANGDGIKEDFEKQHANYFQLSRSSIATDIDSAEVYAYKALEIATKSGEVALLGSSNYLLGLIYYFNGQISHSTSYYRNALTYLQQVENEDTYILLENVWNNIGINEDITGRTERAAEAYRNSLRYARLLNNEKGEAQTLLNIALIDIRLGILDSALQNLNRSREYFLAVQDKFHLGLIYQNYGMYFERSNQPEQAVYKYNEAIRLFKEGDNAMHLRLVKQDMLRFQIIRKNESEALKLIDFLTDDYTPDPLNFRDLPLLVGLGLYEKKFGEPEQAIYFFEQALHGLQSSSIRFNKAIIYLNLAEMYGITGQTEKFSEYVSYYWQVRAEDSNDYYDTLFLQFSGDNERQIAESKLRELEKQLLSGFSNTRLFWASLALLAFLIIAAYFKSASLYRQESSTGNPPTLEE